MEVTFVALIAVAFFPKRKTNNEKTNEIAIDRVWTEFSFGLLPQVIDRRLGEDVGVLSFSEVMTTFHDT